MPGATAIIALLAFVCFILAAFGVAVGVVDLHSLGLALVAIVLLLGAWPLDAAPWRRT